MDRHNPMPKGVFQEGFIRQICLPLYKTLNTVPGLNMSVQVQALEANARHWVGDTSQPKTTRLKETKSFSLQKKVSASLVGDNNNNQTSPGSSYSPSNNNNNSNGNGRSKDEENAVVGVPIQRSKSNDEFMNDRSDVRQRLNLSPRAFLTEGADGVIQSSGSAVRDAIMRSRAAKSTSQIDEMIATPLPSRAASSPNYNTNAQRLPISPRRSLLGTPTGSLSSSELQSAKKSAMREEDASSDHLSTRRRKPATTLSSSKSFSETSKPD